MDPIIGTIMMIAFGWAPRGWMLCNGQLLSIQQNTALFSLLGTAYGGDGVNTFALPDLRGCAPVGMGNGPSLTPIALGQRGGVESVTMTSAQMPAHVHAVVGTATGMNASVAIPATTAGATMTTPSNLSIFATGSDADGNAVHVYTDAASNETLLPFNAPVTGNLNLSSQPAGGNQPVQVRNPYVGCNFIIATEGIYPSRP